MKQRKLLFTIAVIVCFLLFSIINGTHGPLLPSVIAEYGIPESQQGNLYAAQNVGGFAALVFSLLIMGRVRKATIMMVSTVITVLLVIPMGIPPAFKGLTVLFGVAGASMSFTDTTASACIAEMYQGKSGRMMMCVLHACFGLGGILTPPLMQRLLDVGVRWNHMLLGIGLLGCLIAAYAVPVCVRQNRLLRDQPKTESVQTLSREALKSFFGNRKLMLLIACTMLQVCYSACFMVWTKRYIQVELGNEMLGTLTLTLFWVGMLASRLLVPLLPIKSDQYLYGSIGLTTVFLLIGILSGNGLVLCVCSTIAILCSGATVPIAMQRGCELYTGNTQMTSSFFLCGTYLAQAASQPVVGAVAEKFGLTWGMMVSPVVCAAACVLAFLMSRIKVSSTPSNS